MKIISIHSVFIKVFLTGEKTINPGVSFQIWIFVWLPECWCWQERRSKPMYEQPREQGRDHGFYN